MDDAQRGGIDCFRQHLVSPLEGVDAVDQIDAQLIDIHKSVGELNQSIAFALTVLFSLFSRPDSCLVHHDVTSLDQGVSHEMLTHHFHLLLVQVGITLTDHLRNQVFRDGLCRCRATDGTHNQVIVQHIGLQVVKLFLHDLFGSDTGQRLQPFDHDRMRIMLLMLHVTSHRAEVPVGSHHLFHEQRGRDGFQEIIDCHLHLCLLCIGHSDHVHEACRLLPLAITSAATDDLDHLSQRPSHTYGEAHLAPLPVESLLGSTQGNDDVHILLAVHPLQIGLHPVALLGIVFHQISHLQQTAIRSLQGVYPGIVVFAHLLADQFHDPIGLFILVPR